MPVRPFAPPSSRTSVSRATMPLARGQGCPLRQEPSISRAAIPASRIRGPSRHQIGPSPSHILTGVQVNEWPLGTTATASRNIASISPYPRGWWQSCVREEWQCIGPRSGFIGCDVIAAQTHRKVARQLRYRTAPCGRVATPNIGHQRGLGGCERHLEMEGETIFIDSEHARMIEQTKNIHQGWNSHGGIALQSRSALPHMWRGTSAA